MSDHDASVTPSAPLPGTEDRYRQIRDQPDMTDPELMFLFELSADELARVAAGDTSVWDTRLDQDFDDRLTARVAANDQARARQAQAVADRAATLHRVATLLADAGVPPGMRVGNALQAGFLTLEQVNAVLRSPESSSPTEPPG